MSIKKDYLQIVLIISLCLGSYLIGTQRSHEATLQAIDTTLRSVEVIELSQSNTLKCINIITNE